MRFWASQLRLLLSATGCLAYEDLACMYITEICAHYRLYHHHVRSSRSCRTYEVEFLRKCGANYAVSCHAVQYTHHSQEFRIAFAVATSMTFADARECVAAVIPPPSLQIYPACCCGAARDLLPNSPNSLKLARGRVPMYVCCRCRGWPKIHASFLHGMPACALAACGLLTRLIV